MIDKKNAQTSSNSNSNANKNKLTVKCASGCTDNKKRVKKSKITKYMLHARRFSKNSPSHCGFEIKKKPYILPKKTIFSNRTHFDRSE